MERQCVVCAAPLTLPPKGRIPRFCGVACRMAAYRRRRQQLPEQTPRWTRPRGKLRLSRLEAFEREKLEKERRRAERLAQAEETAEWRRTHAQKQATQAKRAAAEAARQAVAEIRARQLRHRMASRPRR